MGFGDVKLSDAIEHVLHVRLVVVVIDFVVVVVVVFIVVILVVVAGVIVVVGFVVDGIVVADTSKLTTDCFTMVNNE